MATATTERAPRLEDRFRSLGRDEQALRVYEHLTLEPQSGAALGRAVGMTSPPDAALGVLESRGQAKRVRTTRNRFGWVRGDAPAPAVSSRPALELDIDAILPEPAVVNFADMFVDEDYQRALSTFVEKITANLKPHLLGVLVLSDRGPKHKPRYAVVDGQTRRTACMRRGLTKWTSIIYRDLTPGQEATLFADIQSARRGTTSWDRFRAMLAGDPDDPDRGAEVREAHEIYELARQCGYELGHASNKLKAIAALESCYRVPDVGPFLLERTLVVLRAAFPTEMPPQQLIRGLHYWMRDPKGEFKDGRVKEHSWDDDKLIRRLRTASIAGLNRRALAAAEISGGQYGAKHMAQAIDGSYRGGARAA